MQTPRARLLVLGLAATLLPMACETTAAAPPDARPDVAIVSDVEPFDAPDAASPLDAPGAMDALRLDAPPDATRDGSRQCPIGCAAGCGEGRRCPP